MFEHEKVTLGYDDLRCETTDIGRRYYTPTGEHYPSITTVLGELSKDSIMKWRARVGEEEANKISTRAANRGTAVHNILENMSIMKKYQKILYLIFTIHILK